MMYSQLNRVRNSKLFGYDKIFKPSFCRGGCRKVVVTWTSLMGVGWGGGGWGWLTCDSKSEVSTVK